MSKRFDFIIAKAGHLLSLLAALLMYPFRIQELDLPRLGPDALCVHGHMHNDSPWRWLRRQLQKTGVGPVNTVYYPSLFTDIPESSRAIQARIKEIGRPVWILIGHSEGGLVALEYALELAPKDSITYVITLGSPLQGTTLAKLGFGPGARQMTPGSGYLRSLKERLKKADHVRLLAIGSEADSVIRPHSAAFFVSLPEVTNVEIPRLGHMQMIFSKKVVREIALFLRAHHLIA